MGLTDGVKYHNCSKITIFEVQVYHSFWLPQVHFTFSFRHVFDLPAQHYCLVLCLIHTMCTLRHLPTTLDLLPAHIASLNRSVRLVQETP